MAKKPCAAYTANGGLGRTAVSAVTRRGLCSAIAACPVALLLLCTSATAYATTELPSPLSDEDFLSQGRFPAAMVELGRFLFFDPILSGNRNIACGTCHDPANGTGDGLPLGIGEGGIGAGSSRRVAQGVTGRVPRNAQPLYNLGALEYTRMFHDGRLEVDTDHTFASGFWNPAREQLPAGLPSLLAAQAMFPVLSAIEMAGQRGENDVAAAVADDRLAGKGGAWDILAERLRRIPEYVALFVRAFDEITHARDIRFVHAARALAAFQATAFRADNSPFDRYLNGDSAALNDRERAGMALFYGKAGCAQCHAGALLTDHRFHAIGMPQTGPGKGHGEDSGYWRAAGFPARLEDEGRYRVSFDTADLFRFRTPSLRNVEITGPWGHSGAYGRLQDVIRHHLDPLAALEQFDVDGSIAALPVLEPLIEASARGSALRYLPLNPARRDAFDLRDSWVMRSKALRDRIAAANELEAIRLNDREIDTLVAFLKSLTDPSARRASGVVPERLPSGLTPEPQPRPQSDPSESIFSHSDRRSASASVVTRIDHSGQIPQRSQP